MTEYFSPMLLPNNPDSDENLLSGGLDFSNLKSDMYMESFKLDGVRAEVGWGHILTRDMHEFTNIHINKYFEELIDLCEANKICVEGELYSKTVPFDKLSGILRSKDKPLPDDLTLYGFDCVNLFQSAKDEMFHSRYDRLRGIQAEHFIGLSHSFVKKEDILKSFEDAILLGYEGLVLINPYSRYKKGRVTLNENIAFKMKKLQSTECMIIGVIEEMENNSVSYKDNLGKSKKHKKKEDLVPSGRAGAFNVVTKDNKEQKISLSSMTIPEKRHIFLHKSQYMGRWIEVVGMESSTGKVRIPSFVRYREDLDATDVTKSRTEVDK
jgi:ATP-dependent DNA ligase